MQKINLEFSEIKKIENFSTDYTETCSGDRSDCCTRVCTRHDARNESDLKAWETYLEIVSGTIQY